jgi:hypothetical protein
VSRYLAFDVHHLGIGLTMAVVIAWFNQLQYPIFCLLTTQPLLTPDLDVQRSDLITSFPSSSSSFMNIIYLFVCSENWEVSLKTDALQ